MGIHNCVNALIEVDVQKASTSGAAAVPGSALLIEVIYVLLRKARSANAMIVLLQNDSSMGASSDTVSLNIVDRDRMAVSLINSLYSGFGTGICTEKTGVMLHNRGTGFVVEPGHPNTIAPGKRPMHTMMPALAMRDGRCEMSFGVMGAYFQPMGHAHVITSMVDYGMDIQQAIDAPRVFYADEITEVERGVSEETVAGLKALGHDVALRRMPHSGGQA